MIHPLSAPPAAIAAPLPLWVPGIRRKTHSAAAVLFGDPLCDRLANPQGAVRVDPAALGEYVRGDVSEVLKELWRAPTPAV
jgi:hypothetical protein